MELISSYTMSLQSLPVEVISIIASKLDFPSLLSLSSCSPSLSWLRPHFLRLALTPEQEGCQVTGEVEEVRLSWRTTSAKGRVRWTVYRNSKRLFASPPVELGKGEEKVMTGDLGSRGDMLAVILKMVKNDFEFYKEESSEIVEAKMTIVYSSGPTRASE